jgi:hypothetical protein
MGPSGSLLLAAFLGMFAGFATTAISGRWMALFLAAIFGLIHKKDGAPGSGSRSMGGLLLLLLHPAPWLIFVGLPYFAHRFLWLHPTSAALCFFWALFAAVLFQILLVTIAIRRARKLRADKGTP